MSINKREESARTTISDIARETGFSIATVSRVVNKTNVSYSEKTRKTIEEAIQRLNYKPDMIARSLKERRSYTVALLTPQIDEFYTGIFNSMNEIAIERNYSILWLSAQYNAEIEKRNIALIKDKNIDGVVIATGLIDTSKSIRALFGNLPVTLIEESQETEGFSRIYVDVENLCCDAIHYLAQNGHRKIAYVSAPLQFQTLRDRYRGYKRGLQECELKFDESLVFFDPELTRSDFEGSYQLMRNIVSHRRFTAMLVLSDWAAFAAIKAAKEMNIRIPEDLSIIGFDNLPFTNFSEPPLTTVSQDLKMLGQTAMEMILSLIDGNEPSVAQVNGKLVFRNSVSERVIL